MIKTVNDMVRGEKSTIHSVNTEMLPIKLLELGCLPGNMVEVIEIAPFGDPIYLNINDSHLAIRKEIAQYIQIETNNNESNE
ncbi:MAG: FeoA family protein [Capnocytophaga sp.]|nr:FeoA family protein [Capnocytophaga sp.]